MASTETVILGKKEIAHKLKRIAYQIYEANISQEEVVIAGIFGKRLHFCRKIKNRRRKNLTHKSYTVRSNDG
jgi:pyrimidine operon attenuation protein/uracil phosphoribosyltransferase